MYNFYMLILCYAQITYINIYKTSILSGLNQFYTAFKLSILYEILFEKIRKEKPDMRKSNEQSTLDKIIRKICD